MQGGEDDGRIGKTDGGVIEMYAKLGFTVTLMLSILLAFFPFTFFTKIFKLQHSTIAQIAIFITSIYVIFSLLQML